MKNSSNKEGAAAAELALKAHVLRSSPEILAQMTEGDKAMRDVANMVDLTEAPEDAVCSLVTDQLDSRSDRACGSSCAISASMKFQSDELPEAERSRIAATQDIAGAWRESRAKRALLEISDHLPSAYPRRLNCAHAKQSFDL